MSPYWTVWTSALLFYSAFYTLLVPMPLYLEAVGLPDWQIGFVMGSLGVASLFGRPLAGWINDSLGSRLVILFGTLSLGIGAALVSFTSNPALLFGLRLLQAGGYVLFTTAATALVADLSLPARRGAALALFGAAANVAITIIPGTVGAQLDQLTLGGAFWLSGGLALLASGLVWGAIPRSQNNTSLYHMGGWQAIQRTVLRSPQAFATTYSRYVSRFLALHAPMQGPMLTSWLYGVSFGPSFFTFLPLLMERRGFEQVQLAYAIYGITIISTRILTRRLNDRPNRTWVLVLSMLVNTVGLAGFAFAQTLPMLLGSTALIAAGSGVVHPSLIAMCVDRMEDDQRGRATAGFYLAFDLGIGIGHWILGPVLDSFGLAEMFMTAALISISGAISAPAMVGKFETMRAAQRAAELQ